MNFIKLLEEHTLDHTVISIPFLKNIVITKHLEMMLIAAILMVIIFAVLPRFNNIVSKKIRTLVEMFILFIRDDIVVPTLGEGGKKYTGYFLTLFSFILLCNMLGLVPFGAAATSNISVTAALAISSFLLIVISGILYKGVFGYIKSFIPSGVPWWIVPVLLPIEILGLFTRTFALCIRLFANMLAGHIVIFAFIALIFLFKTVLVAPVSIGTDVMLMLLEILIAFLQAFIFTLLTAIFLGGAINAEH